MLAGADFTLYNVMPFSPGQETQCAADCREYAERTGNDLVLYSLTLHPEGRPAMEKTKHHVASYRALRRVLDFSRDGEWLDLPESLAFYEAKVFRIIK